MRFARSLRSSLIRPSVRIHLNHHAKLVWAQSRYCSSHSPEPIINPSPSASNPQNDHHVLGKQLNLFSTSHYSAGTPLLHADGSHLFLKLQSLLRAQHHAFGFKEVVSPTIYKQSLWERSGHWQNYSDDMFEVVSRDKSKDETWGLKPMNCPGHCLLFATERRSYRELPVRYADFSPLHRDEISGALSGLTRVRRFHQDDGHIFCRPDQVKAEIASTLQMVNLVYSAFGLKPHKLLLSTRPEESFIGTKEEWDKAESQLQSALEESGLDWALNPGDGAFYGPKIDIILRDNHGKEHQTATVQLDFQLPQRFDLEYQIDALNSNNKAQPIHSTSTEVPILIHRAILGSIERFMALLIEHYGGKWPFWMNPHQVCILTLNDTAPVLAHAAKISAILSGSSPVSTQSDPSKTSPQITLQNLSQPQYTIETDSSSETLARKLVHARSKGYGILCLVGKQEAERGDVVVNFLCAADDAQKAARLQAIVEEVLPESTNGEDWRKKKKVTCAAEELRQIMGRLCDEWL